MQLTRRRAAGERLDVLVVCTGNVCRSPYLAARLRAALPDLHIAAAGTRALVGAEPAPEVRSELRRLGTPARAEPARALTAGQVRRAALVVTAERAHRLRVERLDASARDRVFTAKELARALGDRPARGLAEVVACAAAASRAEAEQGVDHDDDLDDPFGLDRAAYALMFSQAEAALRVIVAALGGG